MRLRGSQVTAYPPGIGLLDEEALAIDVVGDDPPPRVHQDTGRHNGGGNCPGRRPGDPGAKPEERPMGVLSTNSNLSSNVLPLDYYERRTFSRAAMRGGMSSVTAFQTWSRSKSKYACTRRLRIPIIWGRGIWGC